MSSVIIPLLIVLIVVTAAVRRVPVYETFVDGAKDGFRTTMDILPHLVGMMVAISMLRASGAIGYATAALRPLTEWLHIPAEVVPLAFLRPLTGSGSLAYTTDLIKHFGPDSIEAFIAATVQGSTDTTFYVIAVYFGAVGIRNSRYALPVGLLSDAVGFAAAIAVCLLLGVQ